MNRTTSPGRSLSSPSRNATNTASVDSVLQKYGYRGSQSYVDPTGPLTRGDENHSHSKSETFAAYSTAKGLNSSALVNERYSSLASSAAITGNGPLRSYRSVREESSSHTHHLPLTSPSVSLSATQDSQKILALEAKLATALKQRDEAESERKSLNRRLADVQASSHSKLDAPPSPSSSAVASLVQSQVERQQKIWEQDRTQLIEQFNSTIATHEAAKKTLTLKLHALEDELQHARRETGDKDSESLAAKRSANDIQLRSEREKLTLEAQIQVLQGQLQAKTDDITALKNQNVREKELREQETREGERLRERIESLLEKITRQENEAGQQSVTTSNGLRHQQEAFDAKISELKHQLQMESQRRQSEAREKEALGQQFAETREELTLLRAQLADEKRRLQDAKVAVADSQQYVLACEAKDLEIRRLTESNDSLRNHLTGERRNKEFVEEKLASVSAERDQYSRQEDMLRRQINEQYQPQISRLQGEIVEHTNTIAILRLDAQSINEAQVQLDSVLRAKDRLAEELKASKERAHDLEVELGNAKSQVIDLNRAVETHRMTERNLTKDLEAARESVRVLGNVEAEATNLEKQLESVVRDKDTLNNRVKTLEAALLRKDQDMDGVIQQLNAAAAFEPQVEMLTAQLESDRVTSRRLQQLLDESRAEVKKLSEELTNVAAVARDAQLTRDTISSERNNFENLWKEERDKHFLASEKLEEALSRLANAHLEIEHREDIAKEIPFLRQQIEQLTRAKKELLDANRDLHDKNHDESARNVRIQLDNEELVRKVSKLQIASEASDRQVLLVQDELSQITGAYGTLQVQFEEKERMGNTFKMQIDAFEIKLAAMQGDNTNLSERVEDLQLQLEDARQELVQKAETASRWEDKYSNLEVRVGQLDELNAISTRRIATLEADNRLLADTRTSMSTLEGTIEGQQKIIAERERERLALEGEIARLRDTEAALHSSESRNVAFQQQVEDLRRVILKREHALQEQDADLTSQSLALSKLQATLTAEQRNVTLTKDALAAAEAQIDDLYRRLQEADAKLKHKGAVEGTLEGTQRVLESTQEELANLKQQFNASEEENKRLAKEHETVLPQLRREVKELRVHAQARQQLFDSVQQELDEKIQRVRQLQKEVDEKQSAIHKLTQEVSELDLQVRDTTHQLERSQLDSKGAAAKADDAASRMRETIRALRDEVGILRDDLSITKDTLSAAQRDLSRSIAEAERYKSELGKSEHTVGKLSVEVTMLRAAMEDKSNAHDHSVHQLAESKEAFYKAQQDIADLHTRLDASEQRQLALARDKMNEMRAKEVAHEAYEKQIEIVKGERADTEQKLVEMEKQKDQIERKLFAVSAERSSLQAQLVTMEAASAANKDAIHREVEEKQRLIAKKGELERQIITLEAKQQKLESQLRIANMDLSAATAENEKQQSTQKALVDESTRREAENRFQLEVSQHRLRNMSIERDEATLRAHRSTPVLSNANKSNGSSSALRCAYGHRSGSLPSTMNAAPKKTSFLVASPNTARAGQQRSSSPGISPTRLRSQQPLTTSTYNPSPISREAPAQSLSPRPSTVTSSAIFSPYRTAL